MQTDICYQSQPGPGAAAGLHRPALPPQVSPRPPAYSAVLQCRVRGCLQCVPLPDRARHEAGCAFRLVQCIHSKYGCTRTFLAKAENTPLTTAVGWLAVLSLQFWALHYTAV